MNEFVKYADFFEFSDSFANRPLRLGYPRSLPREDEFKLFNGEWQSKENIVLKAFMGRQVTDILWGSPPLICISERIVNLLLDNRLTGWGTYPVEVYDRQGNYLPGYYGFAVTSYAGDIDLNQSQIITKPVIPGGKPVEIYIGLYFIVNNWDGSDIFRINHAITITTKRFREVFKRKKIINAKFTSLPDVELLVDMFHLEKYMKDKQS